MKSKKEIINELISSKTVRDYISKSDLSDDDLSMLILSENVWDIELIKKSLPDLQEFHFDLVCDYFAEYLHWLEKFKESDGSFIYVLDYFYGGNDYSKVYFKTYEDAVNNIREYLEDDDESHVSIRKQPISGDIMIYDATTYIVFNKQLRILSTSFDPSDKIRDQLYAVDISKLYPIHSIVRHVDDGDEKYGIVTHQYFDTTSKKPEIFDGCMINIEGFAKRGNDNILWYDHVCPQWYEVIDDNDPEFLEYEFSSLMLKMRSKMEDEKCGYFMLEFFKLNHIKLSR